VFVYRVHAKNIYDFFNASKSREIQEKPGESGVILFEAQTVSLAERTASP
jgi:hypothetical protein